MEDRHDVIVIGGGQAGLAIGHHLDAQGRRFVILEAAAGPAAAWASRWESLRLFTPVERSSLPGKQFPGDPAAYPTRDEVIAYLTEYASDLPVRYSSRVRRLAREGDSYVAELADRAHRADQVVVATGPFQEPYVPPMASGLDPGVAQMHAAEYRSPERLPEGSVLVVGGGNTGYQIAEELAASGRDVHLAVGSRQAPFPQRLLGRDIFRYLSALGIMRATAGSLVGKQLQRRETLIGSSPRKARRQGITLGSRATSVAGRAVTLADGSTVEPAVVIWATGYRLDHSWISLPVHDENGHVAHERGVTGSPGLYVLGMPFQHTRGSALLGWVGDDAAYIAARIAETAQRLSRSGKEVFA
jgi:putative flavoprotein involved in K+ transport